MSNKILWVLFIAFLWPWGNIVGWLATKVVYRKDTTPFSYKIFLGPTAYYRWLRRETDESNSRFLR